MADNCSCCCNGCSSMKMKALPIRHNFPKKLLVATSVLVIITMCLTQSEARSLEHKIRHERRHDSLAQPTKDMSHESMAEPRTEQKRRGSRKQGLTQTKDSPELIRLRNAQADRFKNAMTKIKKKLKNTRAYFNVEKKVLNETREYRDGMPSWLPTLSFVDIHFHNYKSSRRTGATITEKKFAYLIPKLYKSLVEFQDIFKQLLKVEVSFADDPFTVYNRTRQGLLQNTLNRLYSTIAEIKDNMMLVNMKPPELSPNKNLNTLDLKVDVPECLKNDYIAFRAYGNFLNNWYFEFRCPKGKKVISDNSRCAAYEAKLKEKKDLRSTKGKRTGTS